MANLVNKILMTIIIAVIIFAITMLPIEITTITGSSLFVILRFVTTIVLPWIALYWFIRLVKAIEDK